MHYCWVGAEWYVHNEVMAFSVDIYSQENHSTNVDIMSKKGRGVHCSFYRAANV